MIYIVINHFVSCIITFQPLLWLESVAEKRKLLLWTEKDLSQGLKWLTTLLHGLKKQTLGSSSRSNSPTHAAQLGCEGGLCSCQAQGSARLLSQGVIASSH